MPRYTMTQMRNTIPLFATAVAAAFLSSIAPARADVRLPAIFGDHMVLQREAGVPVWGWASAGEKVTVTAGGATASATAGADGAWRVNLAKLAAADEPIDVTVAGANTVTFHDVLVGDVWVCSGQSNMEFQLGGGKYGFGGAHDAVDEIPKADHPTLRLFIVKKAIAFAPQTDCQGTWKVCTPETAPYFSAVGYFFGREINAAEHVPVGLIGTYWGGTPAEAWTSEPALRAAPELSAYADAFDAAQKNLPAATARYQQQLAKWKAQDPAAAKAWRAAVAKAKADGSPPPREPAAVRRPIAPDANPHAPTVLSNGMIAPIVPYAIRGAIWYQGEANAPKAAQYRTLFPAMIRDWRARWGQGDFPFLWVQLAAYMPRTPEPTQAGDGWPALREAQAMTLSLPNTGQALAIDVGQANDIHPKDKVDVGHRLALAARRVAYGEDVADAGPTFKSMAVDDGKVRVTFVNVAGGLTIAAAPSTQPGVAPTDPGTAVKGFAIAGADHRFVWATATIEGQDTVVLSNPDVPAPVAVRYAWANNPEVNLYNKGRLPAVPFRTDDWAGQTAGK